MTWLTAADENICIMFEELEVVRMASAMARHAGSRHRVIAENVANADTPGYRARDVRGFSDYMQDEFSPRTTRAGHVGGDAIARASARQEPFFDLATQASGNGNSVSLEREMVKAVEAQGQHNMATAIYRKMHTLMRLGLGRGR